MSDKPEGYINPTSYLYNDRNHMPYSTWNHVHPYHDDEKVESFKERGYLIVVATALACRVLLVKGYLT